MAQRPENKAPPQVFYDSKEARKYIYHTHTVEVQTRLAERALELLDLDPSTLEQGPALILDLGCGTGLSGDVLSRAGHLWVGLDIAAAMLSVAVERDVDGDLIQLDLGAGLPFQIGCFDGAVSISVLQWLCHADASDQDPRKRLFTFFMTLYACLRRGARAVFQFYPSHERQVAFIFAQAKRAGFDGGLVVDYPNSTRAKKFYLVLQAGPAERATTMRQQALSPAVARRFVEPMTDDVSEDEASLCETTAPAGSTAIAAVPKNRQQNVSRKSVHRRVQSVRRLIEKQRLRRLRQGKPVRPLSKYSGRKRSSHF
jgi:18S rRNA (guanine1575-N7)-methyltransferase